MLAFRSEGDVDAWCERRGIQRGAVMSLEQIWALAPAWYGERATAGWRGRTTEEAQQVVSGVGLHGDFWEF
jgi:hypothetical protein